MSEFCSSYNTQHALSNLLFAQTSLKNSQKNCSHKSGVAGRILMDLWKAFGCLPHALIIAKIHAYGLDHDSLRLIRSYLSNRHQIIKLDSVFSSWMQTIVGVPQVSILGPLLSEIFLNDLLLINLRSIVCNFADDKTLYYCGETTENVMKNLQWDLKIRLKWFRNNQMMANPGRISTRTS